MCRFFDICHVLWQQALHVDCVIKVSSLPPFWTCHLVAYINGSYLFGYTEWLIHPCHGQLILERSVISHYLPFPAWKTWQKEIWKVTLSDFPLRLLSAPEITVAVSKQLYGILILPNQDTCSRAAFLPCGKNVIPNVRHNLPHHNPQPLPLFLFNKCRSHLCNSTPLQRSYFLILISFVALY